MGMQKSKANMKTQRIGGGFSVIELMITATVLTIITAFGLMGITRARAAIRLSGSAREYASYIEKARVYSIRRHADDESQRANVAINAGKASYDVTMDLDGDGAMDTKTIPLPEGITFKTVEKIAFDWRGRTWTTVGGVTESNVMVSITMVGTNDSVSIDVTGSGDITIDSEVFDDEVPNVNLRVGDLASGATPVPTPDATATPDLSPDPIATPSPDVAPDATPTPDSGGEVISVPTPTPSPTATPTSTPTPTPTPSATPHGTPTPVVCTLATDQALVVMFEDGTATIKVSVTATATVSISGTSSKASDLQVSPGGNQNVGSGSFATFTIKSKKSAGAYTVTFSSSCDTKVVPVTVRPKLL